MNGDAEKCDAYDKIDSASNNLNLVFILIHIKLRFIGVKISQLAEKRKGTKSLSPIALLHNLIFIDTGDECKSGFFKMNLTGGAYEAYGEDFTFAPFCLPVHSAGRVHFRTIQKVCGVFCRNTRIISIL